MIKLGPQTEQALNKQFPDNWKAIAIMMNIPCEYDEKSKTLTIEFSDTAFLEIDEHNAASTNCSLPKEMVAQLIVELAKQET